ncbi:MAG: thiaminase II [Gaiellaceae bacterium]
MAGPVATSACEAFREQCRDVWQSLLDHPFVRELAAGTLPLEKFRFFVEQDLLFLEDSARAIGFAVGRADTEEVLRALADELQILVDRELESERELLRRVEELAGPGEAVVVRPTTLAYGSFLVATAARGDALDVLAAFMPCSWSYAEIGLARAPKAIEHPVYAEWLRFFGGAEYVDSITERRALLDRLASSAGLARRRRLAGLFATGARLESAFWEMAYREDGKEDR